MSGEILRSDEMALVEVSLAYAYQVDPYEEHYSHGHNAHSSLAYK
mgnify:CR=1 FL=1